ncbi:MAG: DNA replication/repair protein RecF [Crocinitomicaceae bacterium]
MHLSSLSLINFKNHSEKQFDLCSEINVFTGCNGVGKTNILDAVHYLSLCKSFINSVDKQNIKIEASFFMVQGSFFREEKKYQISISVQTGQKKKVKRNKKEYDKLADHIGEFPVVVISPYDSNLVSEGSDVRRRFIDSMISQFDKNYLEALMKYNKVLLQRNSLLRQFQEMRLFDLESIEVWDSQLISLGNVIHQKRASFLLDYLPRFQYFFNLISDGKEEVGIEFNSQLNERSFTELLEESHKKDSRVGYSTIGIHKDDLVFTIHNGQPIKKFGSQGQQKSFLIALKLTQFDYIQQLTGKKPILLLDDIFDKLDHYRVESLMRMVSAGTFGQVLITDTDKDRIKTVFATIDCGREIFEIE